MVHLLYSTPLKSVQFQHIHNQALVTTVKFLNIVTIPKEIQSLSINTSSPW